MWLSDVSSRFRISSPIIYRGANTVCKRILQFHVVVLLLQHLLESSHHVCEPISIGMVPDMHGFDSAIWSSRSFGIYSKFFKNISEIGFRKWQCKIVIGVSYSRRNSI